MSPPADHVPRTPDRRSSAHALFTAFRSLTSGRLKSPTPPPSTSSATCDPARTPSLGPTRAGSVASPHSADGTLQRLGHIVAQRSGRPVTGGPPELDELIAQLDHSHPFAERAVAVDKICAILDEYPVQNVLGLWSVASDLLLPEQPDEVAEVGYRLLKGCVSLSTLATAERNVFFDAASLRKNDRYFDKRLDVVTTLTKGGRDIEACEASMVPFVLTSLDACFKASSVAHNTNRKLNGKRSVANPTRETTNMENMFRYAINVCKFNAKIFTHDDLDDLLRRVVATCRGTTQESDLASCIKLFDTVITYIHVPIKSLRPCLEVLSEIYKRRPNLQDQAWNTLTHLFKSHVGQAAISALLHILLDGPTKDAARPLERVEQTRLFGLYRGTTQVLQVLLFEDGRDELPKVPMALLFPALKASIKEPHNTQEAIVIGLIDTVLSQDNMRGLLLAETDLSDILDIIRTCAERDDDRVRAKRNNTTNGTAVASKAENGDQMSPRATETLSHGRFLDRKPLVPYSRFAGGSVTSGHIEDAPGPDADDPVTAPRQAIFHRDADDGIYQVLTKLDLVCDSLDFVQREAVMDLFLCHSNRVNDSICEKVISYFTNEQYLSPSHSNWLRRCQDLVTGILKDATRPRPIRIQAIRTLRETYDTVEQIGGDDEALQCGALLLDIIEAEDDVEVLHELVDFAVHVAHHATLAHFSDIVRLLKRRINRQQDLSTTRSPPWQPHPLLSRDDQRFGSPCNVVATAYVRLFTRSVTNAARKTCILYETLRAIAGSDRYENDARLTALKLLFRLRADARHTLIISSSSEGERIAAELCRTAETAVPVDKFDENPSGDHAKPEDSSSWREQRKTSGSSPHSSLNRPTGRIPAASGRVSKPIPPLWMYPGPKGLPEEPPSKSSRVVFSHIDAARYPLSDDVLDLEVTLWLELIISLLQKPPDWEIYSYVLVHLGPQLSNQALVRSCVVQLRMLRNVLCEQVRNSSFREPPPHTLLKKADVAVCLFHVLTVIISYHEYFEKSEEDDLVKVFLQGIVQWDRTSKWCIHALSVCCFEIPLSVSKSLDSIVRQLSQIVTKPATAVHILEFLTNLARLPELFKNFREDEFKLVFGVCFRYLQHIRDQRERATISGHRALRHGGASREFTASPEPGASKYQTVEDDLPQYLYSLAYHVITFWFMALKMEDRPKQIPWITRNLYHTDNSGRQIIEEHGQVIVDIMSMVAYTDRDETSRDDAYAKPGDGEVWKKTWIVGNSLVTIETAARTGASIVTTRRPVSSVILSPAPTCTHFYAVWNPVLDCSTVSDTSTTPPNPDNSGPCFRSFLLGFIHWYPARRYLSILLCFSGCKQLSSTSTRRRHDTSRHYYV